MTLLELAKAVEAAAHEMRGGYTGYAEHIECVVADGLDALARHIRAQSPEESDRER